MRFFSYDSKFSQLLLKICYGCYLNLLWFVFSIPLITIGASTTALYYVSLKIVREEEHNITGMFIRSFKENFKQSTVLWLILLAVGIVLGGDYYILLHLRSISTGTPAVFWTLLLALLIAATIVYVIILMYVFPLIASVVNTNFAMIKNSFFIGTHYLFCTIMVFAIHFAMFFLVVRVFTPLIMFGEGLCALLSSYLLSNVIAACSYNPEDQEDE
ncbi:MAG: DUF624 domain-containing protein [Lachnospiraceae bacterium]|nr:DUF624 domain-containing protein [Lachnospiraceae bacterium]